MDYKYILFDLDGTLSDSAPGVVYSIEKTMAHLGRPVDPSENLVRFVGPPLADTFSGYFKVAPEEFDEVMEVFRGFYTESGMEMQKMFDGVPEMLEALHAAGKILAVATSKREYFAKQVCEEYGISKYFTAFGGNAEDGSRAEKYEVIEYVLGELGITDPSQVLMVGDRLYDVEGATRCGVDCMGVLYGYGGAQELQDAGAKYLAETTADVTRMILE